MIKNHCFDAGVEYKGTHGFRHSHAVLSLEAGADLLYISKRLGHGSIQTTSDTYLDITPQYESSELDKISNHLNSMWHERGKQKITLATNAIVTRV
ncbi:tyrosine-type recombinase/integrase [Pseudogracilibacillus sp. SO30301A]